MQVTNTVIDRTNTFHFTLIDNYILNSAGLSATEQIVYIHLKQYAASTAKCFTGMQRLCEKTTLSANTLRKVLKSLKDKGFIHIQQRFNDSNEYTLLPYLAPRAEAVPKEEKSDEKSITAVNALPSILKFYQENINSLYGVMEREKLTYWLNLFDGRGEIVIKAMEIAVAQGARKLRYIESVLMNWHESGIKTIEKCEAYLKEREGKRREDSARFGHNREAENLESTKAGREGNYDFSKFSDL